MEPPNVERRAVSAQDTATQDQTAALGAGQAAMGAGGAGAAGGGALGAVGGGVLGWTGGLVMGLIIGIFLGLAINNGALATASAVLQGKRK
jgi:hypothetical protein